MTRWLLTPSAEADLESIFDYTLDQWGLEQAERYSVVIFEMFGSLINEPWRGTIASERHNGLLKQSVGSHLIVFSRGDGVIEVVRILHERMDIDRQLPLDV